MNSKVYRKIYKPIFISLQPSNVAQNITFNNIMALFQVTPVARNDNGYTTVKNFNPIDVQDIRAASTGEIASFPTALTAVVIRSISYNQPITTTYLTATTTVTALAAFSAAQSGVLGSGVSGQTTLVAGTKAITITGLTTSSIALVSLVSSLTGSSTVTYQAVCTANTLTLRANVAAGTINIADVSILNYAILG